MAANLYLQLVAKFHSHPTAAQQNPNACTLEAPEQLWIIDFD